MLIFFYVRKYKFSWNFCGRNKNNLNFVAPLILPFNSYCVKRVRIRSYSRSVNNKINHLHERVLRIEYNDFMLSFKNLLEKDVSIHVKNLQKLATEMFKISKNFSVLLMSELFYQKVLIITICEIHMSFLFQMLIAFFMDKRV